MGQIEVATARTGATITAALAGRDVKWYRGNQLKLSFMLFLLVLSAASNGYDGSMMNGLQALTTWQEYFGHPERKPNLFGVYNAIQNIGSILGLPFAPIIADRYGRRAGVFVGCCILIVASILQGSAQNAGMFIASRGLIGFGLSFSLLASPILISELAYPTFRAPFTALFSTQWYLGAIFAAWTTFGTFRMHTNWGWRIPSLLQCVPSLIQVGFIWFLPESPRWNIANGRTDRAVDFIAKYHCEGDHHDPLIAAEIDEIKGAIEADRENKTTTYRSLFSTSANRRRMNLVIALGIFCQWSGTGLISFYLTLTLKGIGITEPKWQTLINGIMQVYNFVVAVGGAMLIERAGRRRLFLISCVGMCISFTAWTICSATYTQSSHTWDPACLAANDGDKNSCPALDANKHAGRAVIAFIFLVQFFFNIAMNPLCGAYAVEILPYALRSKGMMVMNFTISAASMFNQYINPIAILAIEWKYYIVFCVFIAFEGVYIYLYLIETRGPNGPLSLEEIAALFEGPKRWGFQKLPHTESEHVEGSISDKDKGGAVEYVEEGSVESLRR
ncbi:hypothetical protein Q8F55_009270 [Vanrija albida]|uniref:Major facilitator superfamily (MFS) profile domain-containing protein n=1 Tax=Vanrija albida TaxID=181172 RepID=A0ABR3PTF3_9TREE